MSLWYKDSGDNEQKLMNENNFNALKNCTTLTATVIATSYISSISTANINLYYLGSGQCSIRGNINFTSSYSITNTELQAVSFSFALPNSSVPATIPYRVPLNVWQQSGDGTAIPMMCIGASNGGIATIRFKIKSGNLLGIYNFNGITHVLNT